MVERSQEAGMIPREACRGCYDDFYNKTDGARCWSAKDGRMMTRYRIHFMTAPTEPGAFTKVKAPSCYRQVNSYVYRDALPSFVKASDLNRAKR
jgi:hypothetical protein